MPTEERPDEPNFEEQFSMRRIGHPPERREFRTVDHADQIPVALMEAMADVLGCDLDTATSIIEELMALGLRLVDPPELVRFAEGSGDES